MNPATVFMAHWGTPVRIEPLGAGHINHTWSVTEGSERWVLQQINRRVFSNPYLVMRNIERVLAHVGPELVPELRYTRDQHSFAEFEGEVWRVWRYVERSDASKYPQNLRQARAAGAAYGAFHRRLRDLPLPALEPSIQGFHQLEHFLRRFDALNVRSDWSELIKANRSLASLFSRTTGHIHGDCKFENLLFESGTDRVLAIVDLDTLMPGHWGMDWGDLVRSAFVSSGVPDRDVFTALSEGFLPHVIRPTVDELVLAPRHVAGMLGVRYLIDHAEGDVWFKVDAPGENLARAARQFRFVQGCIDLEQSMREWAAAVMDKIPADHPSRRSDNHGSR